ncbi:hypothetical protein RI367_004450 [Sorochytrium milnesiophthora]
MGGGGRFPYPKWVYSPAGGWWPQPKNWKSNTAVIGAGMAIVLGFAFKFSADNEERHRQPTGWIPSMMWSKWFRDQEQKKLLERE